MGGELIFLKWGGGLSKQNLIGLQKMQTPALVVRLTTPNFKHHKYARRKSYSTLHGKGQVGSHLPFSDLLKDEMSLII